jgi:uncharacterized Tic20 family protein
MYKLSYYPSESERENASNAYIITLMTVTLGLPFPILNLFACVGFYFLIRKKTPFSRFHSLQAITSQVPVILMNSAAIIWTITILFQKTVISNVFISYVITVFIFNVIDITYNIIAAMKARNGLLYSFAFFGPLSWVLVKDKSNPYV